MSDAPPSTQPLVLVEDVHTYYGKSHILHGVSLQIGAGEVVGLLGRNGVGKSTTLKTIMGLVEPSQGKVLLDGDPITGIRWTHKTPAGIAANASSSLARPCLHEIHAVDQHRQDPLDCFAEPRQAAGHRP